MNRRHTILRLVAGTDSLADLYAEHKKVLALPNETFYEEDIQKDILRTFRADSFMEKNGTAAVRNALRALVKFSPIGYIQGQNFLAAAAVYFFKGRLPYMSFWLLVSLFDNLKHIYILPIDATFAQDGKMFAEDTERIVALFFRLYKNKRKECAITIPMHTVLAIKNMVQWKLLGTLMLAYCKDLRDSKTILLHFLPNLHDRTAFRQQASATALAFLLCCFMDKDVNDEVVLAVQNGALTEQGLFSILQTSKETASLL